MKNKLFLTLCIVLSQALTVSAQQPVMVWYNTFGGTEEDVMELYHERSLCTTNSSGYVWAGDTHSDDGDVPGNNGSVDIFLVKHNSSDAIAWTKSYGGSDADSAEAIRQTSDGGFIVVGTTCSHDGDVTGNNEDCMVWVMDLGTGGNVNWQNFYSVGSDNNHAYSIAIVDGGYVISASSLGGTPDEYWLMKISETGQELWQLDLPEDYSIASNIEATSDGGVIGTASTAIIKVDADGNIEWSHNLSYFLSNSIIETPDGGFLSASKNHLTKLDSEGNIVEIFSIPDYLTVPGGSSISGNSSFSLSCIIPSVHGGFLACGNWLTSYDFQPQYMSAIFRFDENFDFDWFKVVPLDNVVLCSIIELQNGNLVAGGTTTDNSGDCTDPVNGVVIRFEYPTVTTEPLNASDTELCPGETFEVNATYTLDFQPPYEIQLSDASGDFSNPVVLLETYQEMNECTIPMDTPAGDGYRIRFVSTETGQVGFDNGEDITISPFLNPKFSESMGSVTGTTTIAEHEAANGFHQDGFTMSGTGTVSNTNPSSGYENATGAANIFLGNTGSNTFLISDINTNGDDLEYLQFGVYMSNLLTGVEVAVSSNGTSYTNLSFLPPLPGWKFVTATGSIPQTSNLRIRFTRTGFLSGDIRIDDVKLIHDPVNPQIDASGPTSFCGPGSVTLVAPAANSHLWNTGATTQTINVSTTGNYSCTLGSPNGCDLTIGPVHVQTTALNYYTDSDGDGYGDPATQSLLCEPDATHTITVGGDCNDQDPAEHSWVGEICDGIDNNCNGQIDESLDQDHDGYTVCMGDCDDHNAAVNPGVYDIVNSFDDNCNGEFDESYFDVDAYYLDWDNDSYGDPLHPFMDTSLPSGCVTNFLDCDDTDPEVYASAEEICGDGKDNNCDGIVDNCECFGDLDYNGAVNIGDLLLFTSAFGNVCN